MYDTEARGHEVAQGLSAEEVAHHFGGMLI